MNGRVYDYFIERNSERTYLFSSVKFFEIEKDCLDYFENGLKKSEFSINKNSINQHWEELGLWGLIGRCWSVELIKVLCAHGCLIKACNNGFEASLSKSYIHVRFQIKIPQNDYKAIEKLISIPLGEGTGIEVNPFLYLKEEETLNLGFYYLEPGANADSSFPTYFRKLEKDLCLKDGEVQKVLSRLFYLGFEIEALVEGERIVLCVYDLESKAMRGFEQEETLFYLGN